MALAALLAVAGAFGLGFTIGSRHERAAAGADIAMWQKLASELQAENGRLRCEGTPAPASGEPPSGKPNALQRLRNRLDFGRGEVAQALGIAIPDVETLEHTRLGRYLLSPDALNEELSRTSTATGHPPSPRFCEDPGDILRRSWGSSHFRDDVEGQVPNNARKVERRPHCGQIHDWMRNADDVHPTAPSQDIVTRLLVPVSWCGRFEDWAPLLLAYVVGAVCEG